MSYGYPNDNNKKDKEMKHLAYTVVGITFIWWCIVHSIYGEDIEPRQTTKPEVVKNDEGGKVRNN